MDIEQTIIVEQASYIHRNLLIAIVGGFIVNCLVAVVFWQVAGSYCLMAWIGIGAILMLLRIVEWRRYRIPEFLSTNADRCLRRIGLGALISGCFWAVGWLFFFFNQTIIYQLLFIYAVAMMGVTAMFTYGVHQKTFRSFFLPTVMPALVLLPLQRSVPQMVITFSVLLFGVVVLRCVSSFNRIFNTSLRLRFENTELVTQLTQQREAADSANLAKSRFLAAASHDLRQPMHALNLYLGAFAGHSLSTAAASLLDKVRQCAQTMDEMFRALLDISRLDAGAVQPEIRDFELQPLLARIRVELEPQARAKNIELRMAACNVVVNSDPRLVEHILRNLIGNAVNHTERGKVLVGCRRRGQRIALWICDTGPGIAADQQRLIFEEFYQIGNRERDRSKGLGLGLAIVDRLGTLLSTPINLVSTLGRGSIFSIELSLSAHQATAGSPQSSSHARQNNFAGILVVVIDDEELILDSAKTLLELWGCEVITATSGASAIQCLSYSTRPPDIIICDYRLRDNENGIDVIHELRTEFNMPIPALLITGDTAPDQILQINASNFPVLHKPLHEAELNQALCKLSLDA